MNEFVWTLNGPDWVAYGARKSESRSECWEWLNGFRKERESKGETVTGARVETPSGNLERIYG